MIGLKKLLIVIAGLLRKPPLVVYDRREAVMFTVLDIGSPGSMMDDTRRGVLQPFLKWTTRRVTDQPGLIGT